MKTRWKKECELINQLVELSKRKFDDKAKKEKDLDSKIKKVKDELAKFKGRVRRCLLMLHQK